MMTTTETIKVYNAFKDGKTIQHKYRHASKWVDDPNPEWVVDQADYRVKPKSNHESNETNLSRSF